MTEGLLSGSAAMWDELGIAPSDDPKTIRRAYAARLKTLDPDRDPVAFARLRSALEWALGHSTEGRPRARPVFDGEPVRPQPAPPRPPPLPSGHQEVVQTAPGFDRNIPASDLQWVSPLTAEDEAHDLDMLRELEAALRRGSAVAAAESYKRAAASGALSIDGTPVMLHRLLGVVASDTTLEGLTFRDLATSLAWNRLDGPAANDPALYQKINERMAAEDWYDGLVASAARAGGPHERYYARLLLKRRGRFFMQGSSAKVRAMLTAYRVHAQHLGQRIDPAWVARLERRLRRREIAWLTLGCLVLAWAVLTAVPLLIGLVLAYAQMTPPALWGIGVLLIVLLMLNLGRRVVTLFRLAVPERWRLAMSKRGQAMTARLRGLPAALRRK
jgi:hypothetical protein